MEKRYEITFEYADALSRGNWNKQSCSICSFDKAGAVQKCKKLYGLGSDCEYRIISVKEV